MTRPGPLSVSCAARRPPACGSRIWSVPRWSARGPRETQLATRSAPSVSSATRRSCSRTTSARTPAARRSRRAGPVVSLGGLMDWTRWTGRTCISSSPLRSSSFSASLARGSTTPPAQAGSRACASARRTGRCAPAARARGVDRPGARDPARGATGRWAGVRAGRPPRPPPPARHCRRRSRHSAAAAPCGRIGRPGRDVAAPLDRLAHVGLLEVAVVLLGRGDRAVAGLALHEDQRMLGR
jgi:hypothetical protein